MMRVVTPVNAFEDDLFAPAEPLPAAAAEGFVLCEFNGVTLAVPQADIVSVEHGGELLAPLPGEPVVGWFNSAHGPWPVYALDGRLRAVTERPATSAFLIFVRSQPWPSGLLCERVRIVRARSELPVQPLPAVMQNLAGPICGIARIDKKSVAWILGEDRLAAHLAEVSGSETWHE